MVHNHLYEIEITQKPNYNQNYSRPKLLPGYGDKKFLDLVRNYKKLPFKLNIYPHEVGFEDFFFVMVFFDIFCAIMENLWPQMYHYKPGLQVNGIWPENMGRFLGYYYDEVKNTKFKVPLRKKLDILKKRYKKYLSGYDHLFNNTCLYCNDYGFRKLDGSYYCNSCGNKITITPFRP